MNLLAWLFILSAIGASITVYLIRTRLALGKTVCIIGADCMIVLSSAYNKLFWIHNDIIGLAFYTGSCVLIALLLLGVGDPKLIACILDGMLAAASLMSFVLVLIQWRLIRAWCFWCVGTALLNWLMAFLLTVYSST